MAQTNVKAAKPNVVQRLTRYFNDVKSEMKRVVWPTRPEVISSSWIVVGTLFIFIVLIFFMDSIASTVVAVLARVGG